MIVPLLLSASVQAAAPAPVATDPGRYADKWLVMLSAKVETGHTPEGLDTAAKLPGVSLARIPSSSFKNLMPCYELVVAGAFTKVADARALGGALAAAGVDHALKHSGAFVGDRPELAAACAAMRAPKADPDSVVFGGVLGVPVPVPVVVADRALQGAPELVPRGEEAWSAPLAAQTVGGWSVGSPITAGSYASGDSQCTVTGFVSGVEGVAHFGWREAGLSAPPPCGSPRLTATLDCQADVAVAPGTRLSVGKWTTDWTDAKDPGVWPDAAAAVADGRAHATAERALHTAWKRRDAQLEGEAVRVYTLEVTTGAGEWVCGGGDYMATYVGLTTPAGTALGPFRETTGAEVMGIFRVGDDKVPTIDIRDIITWSRTALHPGGTTTQQARGYCDCPC